VPEQPAADVAARPGDVIELRGLRFVGAHGLLPEELARPQPFEVDLDLVGDLGPACCGDDVAGTVDYARLCEAARAVVEGPHVNLLERLAQLVADSALAVAGGRARAVRVTVRKLRPPVPYHLESAAVTISRAAPVPAVAPAGAAHDAG
jgi:dihydroneopterin aldolase